jgi:hypothetical protein
MLVYPDKQVKGAEKPKLSSENSKEAGYERSKEK